jgi:hypothetical protein
MSSNEKKKRISILNRVKNVIGTKPPQAADTAGEAGHAPQSVPVQQKKRGQQVPQQRARVPLPSYAETIPHNPREHIHPSEPRECRQLLREMYAMNILIMNSTHVFEANKPLIKEKEERAAAALTDLRIKVESWLAVEGEWTPKELKTILEIHEIIKQMQPVPVRFNADEQEEIPSDINETASTVYSYA